MCFVFQLCSYVKKIKIFYGINWLDRIEITYTKVCDYVLSTTYFTYIYIIIFFEFLFMYICVCVFLINVLLKPSVVQNVIVAYPCLLCF